MNLLYLALGIGLLVLAVVDLLWTTLWVEGGAGPVTSRLMAWTWKGVRSVGSRNSTVLTLAGPAVLVLGLAVWISLLWGGWTFVFASADVALKDTVNAGPVSWSDLLYFTGYTIFTLGNGDFVPTGSIWQITTILATASGMLFITLSVTYVLSVLDAVTQKRSLAQGIHGLGSDSTEIVRRSWDGDEFRGLEVPLNTLATQLNELTSNHKAYPILHYFYSGEVEQAPVPAITVLDEALTLLRFGVAEDYRPNDVLLTETRSSVEGYLETIKSAYIEPSDDPPPQPDLESLRDAGVPTVSDEQFAASVAELDDRRRTLLALVVSDERRWPDTDQTGDDPSDAESH